MPINADLFRRVADAIEAEPQHFDMNHYVAVKDRDGWPDEGATVNEETWCNTVMCIGGHAWYLSGLDLAELDFDVNQMGALLGLTRSGAEQIFMADCGFWHGSIPEGWEGWDWMTEHPAEVAAVLRSIADGTIELHPDWVLS